MIELKIEEIRGACAAYKSNRCSSPHTGPRQAAWFISNPEMKVVVNIAAASADGKESNFVQINDSNVLGTIQTQRFSSIRVMEVAIAYHRQTPTSSELLNILRRMILRFGR